MTQKLYKVKLDGTEHTFESRAEMNKWLNDIEEYQTLEINIVEREIETEILAPVTDWFYSQEVLNGKSDAGQFGNELFHRMDALRETEGNLFASDKKSNLALIKIESDNNLTLWKDNNDKMAKLETEYRNKIAEYRRVLAKSNQYGQYLCGLEKFVQERCPDVVIDPEIDTEQEPVNDLDKEIAKIIENMKQNPFYKVLTDNLSEYGWESSRYWEKVAEAAKKNLAKLYNPDNLEIETSKCSLKNIFLDLDEKTKELERRLRGE